MSLMKEIGSEFCDCSIDKGKKTTALEWLMHGQDWAYTFSGRTAIEVVLADIKHIKKILFPSYCCQSMMEPFCKKGIEIQFYDVYASSGINIEISIPDDCEAVLWCNYFGFNVEFPEEKFKEFKSRGGIIIEDITHSLFSEEKYHYVSDYTIASLRKWGALLSGGFCSKKTGEFTTKPYIQPSTEFTLIKKQAMRKKVEYLYGLTEDKNSFLDLYKKANDWVTRHYSFLQIDDISKENITCWDIAKIQNQRKQNAVVLYEKLKNAKKVTPLFNEDQMGCPLFFPIIVKENREVLRNELIKNQIYCPVHWPKPKAECDSNLYNLELSLICDQRYSEKDMGRMVDVILNA